VATRLYIEEAELDGVLHFLDKPDTYIERVLCFPRENCSELEERLELLKLDGFTYLLETGGKFLDLRILGKGYSAIVVVAYNKFNGIGSLKIKRLDSRRESFTREALLMSEAYPSSLPPKLLAYRDFYVFYELLPPGKCRDYTIVLEEYLNSNRLNELKTLLLNTMIKLRKLDLLGIDHTEINRPSGHVFVCREQDVKILDWESARKTRRPVNTTSFTSFLLYRYRNSSKLIETLGIDRNRVLDALRKYKESYLDEDFEKLLEAMQLK